MKKNYTIALFLFTAAFFALASCKKDNANKPVIQLTVVDSGKTLTITSGQIIKVILSNPGDGGYNFNAWQYDQGILHLDNHTRILPTNPNAVGDFGEDEWQFTALKSGLSTLKITASQNSTNTVTMFSDVVKVN